MDPITIGAVLAAIAGGAGGAAGSQLWAGVSALVSRPFRHAGTAPSTTSGVHELAALEGAPGEERQAVALAEVLIARAGSDDEFRQALENWWEQASRLPAHGGNVANTISGGTQNGPVLQGRDFSGLTFGAPAASPRPDQRD